MSNSYDDNLNNYYRHVNGGATMDSTATNELAYYRSVSGLTSGSIADCKVVFLRAQTGYSSTTSITDAEIKYLQTLESSTDGNITDLQLATYHYP